MSRTSRARCFVLLASCWAIFTLGCGKGDAIPETVPVSGKVTVDGKPVTSGQVSFLAYDKEQKVGGLCTGTIDTTGGYVMNTGGKDGAPPGRYKVTVTPPMMPTGDSKMPPTPFDAKFTDGSKTPLVITVTANAAPGAYDLKLTK